jgi:threonyl-tRNA synthetase
VEHYEGKFPVWLAPVQAVVMNITDKQAPYVGKVEKMLKNQGIRVISDLRNEKVGFKIREHTEERVAVRSLGGKDLGSKAVDEFVDLVKQ